MKHKLASLLLPGVLIAAAPLTHANTPTPLPTVEVRSENKPVGATPYPTPITDTRELDKQRPAYSLPQVLEGQTGLISEGVFGGIDHPRLSIRGSGLQRGTQPAGRGIEIREQGLPLGYADTSFDFVEAIDPLAYDEVRVLRSGRAVVAGSSALGGVINFIRRPSQFGLHQHQLRAETGSFGFQSLQGQATKKLGAAQAEIRSTDYRKNGFRQHNKQEALRSVLNVEGRLPESSWQWRAGISDLSSELQLPGPQTFAQIISGSNAAQPGNVRGNWRRKTQRTRINGGLEGQTRLGALSVNMAYQLADVNFIRRDEQDESNEDLTLQTRFKPHNSPWFFEALYQHNERELQQYLNGGGTMPTFTGTRGLKWADNSLQADRLALTVGQDRRLTDSISVLASAGINHHTRTIKDNFQTSANRAAAELDTGYTQWSGMAELRYAFSPSNALFVGFNSVGEPPTYDMLLLNTAGTGAGAALVNGIDPRRPTITTLDSQRQNTLEAGWRHASERALLDFTMYYASLNREVISTLDTVNQVNTNLRNAEDTQRVGAELNIQAMANKNFAGSGADLLAKLNMNWVDARFDNDPVFGNNTLPVITPLGIYSALTLSKAGQWQAELFAQSATRGAFVDYANTVRAGDYLTLGARGEIQFKNWSLFAEARNLTDERYVSTVIGASLNAAGADTASFAPGEPQSFTVGAQLRF